METVHEHPYRAQQMNGPELPAELEPDTPGFFGAYVRPCLPYLATFTAGIICGALGASYLASDAPTDA